MDWLLFLLSMAGNSTQWLNCLWLNGLVPCMFYVPCKRVSFHLSFFPLMVAIVAGTSLSARG